MDPSHETAADSLAADSIRARPSPWTTKQKIVRVLWGIVQATLFRCSPHNFYTWRAWLLRLFGAKLARDVRIRSTARITIPWNLEIGQDSSVGDFAILYCLGKVTMGRSVTISQYGHLCAGTHDATNREMVLLTAPITLGDDVWIAADAFVGPGVTIGSRSIVGARASLFGNVPEGVVVGGNPAKFIKQRDWKAPATSGGGHLVVPR
jgi:putative colanic acid biosynthesis acetyltransferase WcaF